jgi:hypothetical protein
VEQGSVDELDRMNDAANTTRAVMTSIHSGPVSLRMSP